MYYLGLNSMLHLHLHTPKILGGGGDLATLAHPSLPIPKPMILLVSHNAVPHTNDADKMVNNEDPSKT